MSQCVKHKDTDTRQIKLLFSIPNNHWRVLRTHLLTALAMSSVSFNSPRSIPRLRDKWDKQTNEEEEIDRCLRSHSIWPKGSSGIRSPNATRLVSSSTSSTTSLCACGPLSLLVWVLVWWPGPLQAVATWFQWLGLAETACYSHVLNTLRQ